MKPERCKTCHSNLLYPNPEGCWECNPKVLGEKYEALRDEHSGCSDSEWCPVCSGDCDGCSARDDEIAELRVALDKTKAEAMNLCSLLEAKSSVGTRRDWAKFARQRVAEIDPEDDPPDMSRLKVGRADAVDVGEGSGYA